MWNTKSSSKNAAVGVMAGESNNSPLTKREQEVLELVAFGLSNKEIAQRLGLGKRTVETHIDHVLSKLDAQTRTRAVVEAGRAGLLGPGPAADSSGTRPHNLPFQLTTLIGREQDLAGCGSRQLFKQAQTLAD